MLTRQLKPSIGQRARRALGAWTPTRDNARIVVEISWKRAVLAGQVAYHHFRLLSALKAASEYASHIGRLDVVGDLEQQRGVVAGFSTQVSAEADGTHSLWVQLRGTYI